MSRGDSWRGWLGAEDNWWRWLTYSIATTIVWLFAMLMAFTVVASIVWKTTPRVIISGSMEPALSPGDIILSTDDEPAVGSIITFESSRGLITHRVIALEDNGYVTRGDANQVDDSDPVTPDQVVGVGKSVVPLLGWPRAALANGNYFGLGLWSLTIGASAWVAWNWRYQSAPHKTDSDSDSKSDSDSDSDNDSNNDFDGDSNSQTNDNQLAPDLVASAPLDWPEPMSA